MAVSRQQAGLALVFAFRLLAPLAAGLHDMDTIKHQPPTMQ